MRVLSGVAAVVVFAAAALAAEIGDKAPELEIAAWIQGEPLVVEQCAGKKVVVLEFWATWCEPCKKAIPRFTRLADKYKGKDVEFVTISDEPVDDVKAFMKDGKVKYRVACDKDHNTTATYERGNKPLKHAPFAVLVDKAGNIAWLGEANSTFERNLERVVSGKFDAETAKKITEMERTVDDSLITKAYEQAVSDSEKLLEMDPGNEKGIRANLLLADKLKDLSQQKMFLDKTLPLVDGDANALNQIAWLLATAEHIQMRRPDVALKAAKRAVELSESSDAPMLDTLARCQFHCAMLDQAIETQKKAAALDDSDDAGFKATLEWYQRCAEAKKSAK